MACLLSYSGESLCSPRWKLDASEVRYGCDNNDHNPMVAIHGNPFDTKISTILFDDLTQHFRPQHTDEKNNDESSEPIYRVGIRVRGMGDPSQRF